MKLNLRKGRKKQCMLSQYVCVYLLPTLIKQLCEAELIRLQGADSGESYVHTLGMIRLHVF